MTRTPNATLRAASEVGIHRLQVRGEIALRFEPLLGQTPVLGAWEMRVSENRGP